MPSAPGPRLQRKLDRVRSLLEHAKLFGPQLARYLMISVHNSSTMLDGFADPSVLVHDSHAATAANTSRDDCIK